MALSRLWAGMLHKSRPRGFYKRQLARRWRRAARRDPEGAPTRAPGKYWAD